MNCSITENYFAEKARMTGANDKGTCMIANGAGLWALTNCRHCAYVITVYPTAINGIKCSKAEVEQLYKEMQSADKITKYNL